MRQRRLCAAMMLLNASLLSGCGSSSPAPHATATPPSPLVGHQRASASPHPSALEVTFSASQPADGWVVMEAGTVSELYQTTNAGRQWQRVMGVRPDADGSILVMGSRVWVPVKAPHHTISLRFSVSSHRNWVSQRLQATTRTVPWAHYANVVMPQTTTGAPWLLAASQYLGMTELYTLFRYDTRRERWVAVAPSPLGQRGDATPGLSVTGPHTLWWSTGGNGTQGQLDRITLIHGRATVHAALLPGWPVTSTCGTQTIETDRRVGVPAFTGRKGRVFASWAGCDTTVHVAIWGTTDGGRHWQQAALPSGLYWGQWANAAVGYAWSASGKQWWTTIDGGRHWTTTRLPTPLQRLDEVSPQDLWAIGGAANNQLLHSTDAGLHWSTVPLPAPQ